MAVTQFTDAVEIDGSQDIAQLKVQGHSTQTEPLQVWEDSAADEQAQLTGDGRLQIGSFDSGMMATDDALIEAHRDENAAGKPKRGLHLLGEVTGALSEIVAWAVQELVLKGTGGISALHSALRVRLTNENTGAMDSGADLRAADVEIINNGGSSGNNVPEVTGLQVTVTNQVDGYADTAYGLKVEINDAGSLDSAYAIHTGGGKNHFGEALELAEQSSDPTGLAGAMQLYAKTDGKLYTRHENDAPVEVGSGGGEAVPLDVTTTTLQTQTVLYQETLSVDGNFDIDAIDQGYDHLLVRLKIRSTVNATDDVFHCVINDDATNANYRYAQGWAGTGLSDSVGDLPRVGFVAGATALADTYDDWELRINGYTNNHYKTILSQGDHRRTNATYYVTYSAISWENVAAISALTISPDGTALFAAGSSIEVIGIKEQALVTGVSGNLLVGTTVDDIVLGTVDPGPNDDANADHGVGQHWVNTVDDRVFVCVDNTVGAAIWKQVTPGGSGDTAGLFHVYDAMGGFVLTTSDQALAFDTIVQKGAYFTFTADTSEVTINEDGWYRITYYVTTTITSGTDRSHTELELQEDTGSGWSAVPGTRGRIYNRDVTHGETNAAITILRQLNTNSKLRVVAKKVGVDTVETLAGGLGMTIETASPTVGPKGDPGPQGPPGTPAGGGVPLASVCDGRLTLSSGVPIPTADVLAAATLYFTPFQGNQVALFDGSDWVMYAFTERSLSLSGLATNSLFDIFLYDNSGNLTLEAVAWNAPGTGSITSISNASPRVVTVASHTLSAGQMVTIAGNGVAANNATWRVGNVTGTTFQLLNLNGSNSSSPGSVGTGGTWQRADEQTNRATSLAQQDGVYVQSGAPERRYLGTIRITNIAGECEDSLQKRLVYNESHPVARKLQVLDIASWSYTTNAWRAAKNNLANRVEMVIGNEGPLADLRVAVRVVAGGPGVAHGIGLDTVTATSADLAPTIATDGEAYAHLVDAPPVGYHFYHWVENGRGSSSGTMFANVLQGGLVGTITL